MAGLPRLSQADVLVASRGGGGLLKERMALARSLWDAGISAEMLPQVNAVAAGPMGPAVGCCYADGLQLCWAPLRVVPLPDLCTS